MSEYYLDIETTGLDPRVDGIITIQYQRLGMRTGRVSGSLEILRSWESSEKEILEQFMPMFIGTGPFSFVAIGSNIPFIYSFLIQRSRHHDIDVPDPIYVFGSKPYLDIKPFLVLMNGGSFKGASLDRFTNLSFKGDMMPKLHEGKQYDLIVECIREEAREFVYLYKHLKERAPDLVMGKKEDKQWF